MEVWSLNEQVGASIVEIITESLYDKPIVVFREYVQNSADSLFVAEQDGKVDNLSINIWCTQNNTLCFLDNGIGIKENEFALRMGSIAHSPKSKSKHIGYKGIGRLSGLSYCKKLTFVNILNYKGSQFQTFTIDCLKYMELRKVGRLKDLVFSELMKLISEEKDRPETLKIQKLLEPYKALFTKSNTGFLVVLEDISSVLQKTIGDKKFLENLGWLLPAPFQSELLTPADDTNQHELFISLSKELAFITNISAPAKSFEIFYNGKQVFRPITRDLLRNYLCKSNMEQYAICVHTFSNTGITINSKNSFSGIRIYIDNILLCDESELVPALQQFGLISHTVNETIQAVRGVGALIYIVDKVNISANARRTFIDVADEDSFDFLRLVGEFVESIFQARYALSNYYSYKKKEETAEKDKGISELKERAQNALIKLARQDIHLDDEPEAKQSFSDMTQTDQKRLIKGKISKNLNIRIRNYIEQTSDFNLDTCVNDFITWLKAN